MAFAIQWQSQQGTRTTDNRDCAGIGIRQTAVLAIVLDGSTSGAKSGAFACEIARRMVDWYVATDENITAAVLRAQLRATHAELSIALDDTPLLVMTDGFWAELDHGQQSAFIHGRIAKNAAERDDRSVLQITRIGGGGLTKVLGSEPPRRIYIKRA